MCNDRIVGSLLVRADVTAAVHLGWGLILAHIVMPREDPIPCLRGRDHRGAVHVIFDLGGGGVWLGNQARAIVTRGGRQDE